MARSVTGTLPEPAEVIVEKLRDLAHRHDVRFEGDYEKGWASGKGFHIEYLIAGDQATVTVTKKPLLVPWGMVEKTLAKLF